MRKTENYNLNKSDGLQVDFYENMEIIDAELKRLDDKISQGGGQGGNDIASDVMEQITAMAQWGKAELNKEYWTGKCHVDGKKIYGKIVDFGALPNNTTKTVTHDILNVEKFTCIYGMGTDKSIKDYVPLPWSSTLAANSNISLEAYGDDIYVVTGANRTSVTAIITLEYTCTDR